MKNEKNTTYQDNNSDLSSFLWEINNGIFPIYCHINRLAKISFL